MEDLSEDLSESFCNAEKYMYFELKFDMLVRALVLKDNEKSQKSGRGELESVSTWCLTLLSSAEII